MKDKTLRPWGWCTCALALLCTLEVSAINYPVGTFIVNGLAKNEKSLALGLVADDAALTLQAIATNGTILAESSFVVPATDADPANFELAVPLTQQATDQSAAVGDSVRLCLVKNGVPKATLAEPIVLFSATGATNLVMQLYETVSYTNKNGKVATLPADYVRSLGESFPGQDPLTAYDPFADADGDGVSNYYEYRAGTNPFMKADRLEISGFNRTSGRDAITFEYVGGVVYGVSTSPTLDPAKITWTEREIAPNEQTTPGTKRLMPGTDVSADGEQTTFYLLPTEKASSLFFKLEVK